MNLLATGLQQHPHLTAIVEKAGADDPESAIRILARRLIDHARRQLDLDRPPFDLEMIAGLLGIPLCDESPQHSEDAELVPVPGGVKMRVNRARPHVRRRFSIGHELGHTFFPDYELELKRRHKCDSTGPQSIDIEIERLCDIAASEFVLPVPWFMEDADSVSDAERMVELAKQYEASRDATVRRYVELATEPHAAVYFDWKLKPVQERQLRLDRSQTFMFGIDPEAEAESARSLRVRYSVVNASFAQQHGGYIPANKSTPDSTLIQRAARSKDCMTGDDYIDLGSVHGNFEVWAIPLYTLEEKYGPAGECAVVAVLCNKS